MLIPPLALAVGALGFLIRRHRRVMLNVAIGVQNLARLEADLEDAVDSAAAAARKPWWR